MTASPWVPDSFGVGLGVALLSLVCWGSWSNTVKAAANIPFACYYADYAIGVFLTAGIYFVSLGTRDLYPDDETDQVYSDDGNQSLYKFLAAIGAGAIFNIANLLLVVAIQIAGISIAFPLAIGMALALGTVLTYLIDESGDALMIFSGVGLGICAILSIAQAYRIMEREHSAEQIQDRDALLHSNQSSAATKSTKFKIIICLISGILMSLWSPLAAYSRDGNQGLTTYGSFLLYTAAVIITTPPLLWLQNHGILLPRVGAQVTANSYLHISTAEHCWGLLGGLIWSTGTIANLLSGDELGYAVSYAIGQSAPVVATLWGLLYYKEFAGCSYTVLALLGLMFLFYGGAVAVIALGGDSS